MRKGFAAALTAAALLFGSAAFAADVQNPSHIEGSHQGGALGINPGANVPTAPAAAPQLGSMQGGVLGKNFGATNQPQRSPSVTDATSSPTAFCTNGSIEPSRCRTRAELDHKMCQGRDADHYMSCRRALDMVGWQHP